MNAAKYGKDKTYTVAHISTLHWSWKLARILITVVLIGWMIQKLDWDQVWAIVLTAKLQWLAVALCYPLIILAIDTLRWQMLLKVVGWHVTWSNLFQINLVGMFFDNFLPSGLGSDAYRILHLSRQCAAHEIWATALLGRALNWFGLLVFVLACLLTLQNQLPAGLFWSSMLILGGGLCTLTIGFFLLTVLRQRYVYFSHSRILQRWKQFALFLQSVNRFLKLRILIPSISLSLLLGIVIAVSVVVIATAYNVPSWQLALVARVAPLGLIVTMLPISISGHGVRETTFVYLLSHFGIVPEVALAISVSLYMIDALVSLIGGGIYFFKPVTQDNYNQYLKVHR